MLGQRIDTPYGYYIIGAFNRSAGVPVREDAWYGSLEGEQYPRSQRVHVTSKTDVSAPYTREYTRECAMCWLGYCHSTDLHDRAVAEHIRKTTPKTAICNVCGETVTYYGDERPVHGQCEYTARRAALAARGIRI